MPTATEPTTLPSSPPVQPVHQSLRSLWDAMLQQIDVHALLRENSLLNWVFLLATIFLGVAVGKLVSLLLARIAEKFERHKWHFQSLLAADLAGPASLAIFAFALLVGMGQLRLNDVLQSLAGKTISLLLTIAFFWYAFNIVSIAELMFRGFLSRHKMPMAEQVVPLVRKTLRIFVAIVAVLFILQNIFNRDIGSWLAGLGILGLAASLAAQDSLKNVFGSLTVFFDRPFMVGDMVNYQGFMGRIEEIGLRSVRLRQITGTLVTVPNSDIVSSSVENLSVKPLVQRLLNVTVPYDTPVAKMREAIQIIKDILNSPEFRPNVHDPSNPNSIEPSVYFSDFNADSLNIQVCYYFHSIDEQDVRFTAYKAFNERFNLALMEAYEKASIEFSFPSQTLYLAGDPKRKLPVYINEEKQGK
ncbi:MAG TPA: mechanosensitive ion channel family protein [Phycisphaerae bacterium]|nr:mechanosensitive ion channel family protein [Phycisphaerae bacterium]